MAMTNDLAAPGPDTAPAPDTAHAAPSTIRERLAPERVALMREWVECTPRSFRRIGQELGVSASTVSRYATEGGWKRPAGAALAARIDRPNPDPARRRTPVAPPTVQQRERITQKLWRLAERQAEAPEGQPIERAHRALPPLARTLGEMDKHVRLPLPAGEYEIDHKPRRSLDELRDELVGHLERIERGEREYDERYRWTFKNGAGI